MSNTRCEKHGVEYQWIAGEPAHGTNRYCFVCDDEDFEYQTYFVGCTCEHKPEQHGWGHCKVEGCSCEGGWEE